MQRRKIMVSAYACEPNKGSEPGVGWNWVLQMSKYYELWVLTRTSNKKNIEQYFGDNSLKCSINFVYFDLPKWMCFWKKGMRGVRTYYTLWQFFANKIIKKIMTQNDIHIFHHLTYGNSLWNVSSYGQSQIFIYGPTGGVDTIPRDFSCRFSIRNRLIECIRRFVVALLPVNIGFIRRCKNANIILCKTDYMINAIPKEYQKKAIHFTDVAVETAPYKLNVTSKQNDIVEFIIVGKLDAWRGFDIAIESVANIQKKHQNFHLTIIGEGSDFARLEKLVHKLNVENYVSFVGTVGYNEYHNIISGCDVVLNPALKEGAVTVAFDAMRYGKPLICIDTEGYTKYFNNITSVVKRTSYQQTVNQFTLEMEKMFDPLIRERTGTLLHEKGLEYNWDVKGQQIYQLIESYLRSVENEL